MALWVFFQYWRLDLFRQFAQADSFNTILRQTAEDVTDKHADYLSVYLVFSLFIATIRAVKKTTPLRRTLYALSIPLQGWLLFLLAARSPIIALVIGSLVICFLQIRKPVTRWIVLLGLTACFLVIIRLTPSIWSRIEEVHNTPLATPVGVYHNSTNIRVGIYKCTWELIRQYPLMGIGAGSDRRMLTECYAQFPTDVYQKTFYNTHNQYLNFWLLGGLPSLLLFLASMVWQCRQSLHRKDYIFLFFLLLMAVAFSTENILSRQAGIVFYYFFSCCFLFNTRST
jgi:O-antigen ligase